MAVRRKVKKAPSKVVVNKANRQKLLGKIAEYYRNTYKQEQTGYEYMQAQGIEDRRIYDIFQIGLGNGSIFEIVPKKGPVAESLKETGVITEAKREHFSNCVIFPITDQIGNVIDLVGCSMSSGIERYLPNQAQGIFNPLVLKTYPSLVVTPSIMDALRLYQFGLKNVICLYGKKGVSEEQIKLLKLNKTTELIFMFKVSSVLRESLSFLTIREVPIDTDISTYLAHNSLEDLKEQIYMSSAQTNDALNIQTAKQGFEISFCNRKYIVQGIEHNKTKLKVNIRAVNCVKFHVDTIDLYLLKDRRNFIKDASLIFKEEMEILEQDLNQIILATEKFLEKKEQREEPLHAELLSSEEKKEATTFAKQKDLIKQITKDIEQCGYVGEEMNKLMSYLAMTSRKMNDPLSILIVSGSGAGKSSLQDTILSLCPEEDQVKLTSLTSKALFYKKECSLRHKVLALEEEEGAEKASYAIRNLISAKRISIEATIKDNATGKITTMENRVTGPTAVFKTTTDPDTDPETKSRFITLSIDESREQTKRILNYQRESYTMEGYLRKKEKDDTLRKHHNFQRLLKPLAVFNPYSKLLTYLDDRILVRRENPKYMNIIATVAFLHQMQRKVKTMERNGQKIEYIEVTLGDIRIANEICNELLGHNLEELSKPSERLLELLEKMVKERSKQTGERKQNIHFTRWDIREYTRWSDYQVRTHLKQLVDLEYVLPISGKNGKQYRYELLYRGEGKSRRKFVIGLEKIENIRKQAKRLAGKK